MPEEEVVLLSPGPPQHRARIDLTTEFQPHLTCIGDPGKERCKLVCTSAEDHLNPVRLITIATLPRATEASEGQFVPPDGCADRTPLGGSLALDEDRPDLGRMIDVGLAHG